MSPEERASHVVQNYHATRCWGYDPVQHAEYERLIAGAIREAVADERERCAGIARAVAVDALRNGHPTAFHVVDKVVTMIGTPPATEPRSPSPPQSDGGSRDQVP